MGNSIIKENDNEDFFTRDLHIQQVVKNALSLSSELLRPTHGSKVDHLAQAQVADSRVLHRCSTSCYNHTLTFPTSTGLRETEPAWFFLRSSISASKKGPKSGGGSAKLNDDR